MEIYVPLEILRNIAYFLMFQIHKILRNFSLVLVVCGHFSSPYCAI